MRLSRKEARLQRIANAVWVGDRREALLWTEQICDELAAEPGAVGPSEPLRGGKYSPRKHG